MEKSWIEEYEEYLKKEKEEGERRRRNVLWEIKLKAVNDGQVKGYIA